MTGTAHEAEPSYSANATGNGQPLPRTIPQKDQVDQPTRPGR